LIDNSFMEYSRKIREKSLSLGIPSIDEDEGLILYTLTYTYVMMKREHVVVVDAGAGIGYSTLWLAKALDDAGCNICVVEAIEKNGFFANQIEDVIRSSGLKGIPLNVVARDAIEYIMNTPAESIDILFIDIEKGRYPKMLSESLYKVKKGGFIVIHNALFPPPPRKLFDILEENKMPYTIIPTSNGLLIAHLKANH